jgi:hypothetical protein
MTEKPLQYRRSNSKQKRILYIIAGIILLYIGVIFVRSLQHSLILDKKDRLNIVFYSDEAVLLSFGLKDNVHYIGSFSHKDKVSVPGGYGRYAVGSLGRLANLEKDSDLIGRTFSSMASMYVDFYIFPKNAEVFDKPDTDTPYYSSTDFIKRLFSSDFQTNAGLLDRIYIALFLSRIRGNNFVVIRSVSQKSEDGDIEFSERRFLKKYKGFFYHESLREEGKAVQILYDAYPGAVTLSRVIEGQGIRVVDLSRSEKEIRDRCVVQHNEDTTSKTVYYLTRLFGCTVKKGEVQSADIIFSMGSELTEEWK